MNYKLLLIGLVILMMLPIVIADDLVQRYNPATASPLSEFKRGTGNVYIANDFNSTNTSFVTGIQIQMQKVGTPTGNMWFAIYSANASGFPTTLLSNSSSTYNVASLSTSPASTIVGLNLSTPIVLTSGTKYVLVVGGTSTVDASNYMRTLGDARSGYDIMEAQSTFTNWVNANINYQWNYSLWNSGATTTSNSSFTATNFYTGSAINSFCVTNGSLWGCTTTGTANISGLLTNVTSLQTISYQSNESGGYFNVTYTGVNVSSLINKAMAQNSYTFYAVEKVTQKNLTGVNFTSIYLNNITHYMSNGTYQITASKSGYYNKTVPITATTLQTVSQNISYVGNHTLNITARDLFTNAIINTFNVRVISTTYGYDETYSTTNGIILDNTTSVTLTYEAYATGYFNKTGTLTLTGNASNNTIVLNPYGGLQVRFIRASNGSIITSPVQTVIFQNSTTSISFTGVNGTANVSGLSEDTYQVLCQVTGFDNNSFTYDYPAITTSLPDAFYCVMSAGTTQITYQVQSPDLTPLANVLVQVEQFVNGSYITVASEYTDGTGQSVMNLVQGLTTRVTLSLAGYTTQVNTNNLDSTTYTYTLDPVNRFDPSNSAGSSITYSFYPTQFDLNLSVWGFTLNVTPDSGTLLEYFKITIANINGTTLTSFTSTNSSGGNITIPFNTAPYNGSVLRVTYSFKKTDNTEYSVLVVYNIADRYVTGSIVGARQYILANFDLGERIFLWMFLTIVSALLLSALGIKDLLNVLLVSMIWLGLAYVFAMNMVIVGFIFFLLFLAIVRYTL